MGLEGGGRRVCGGVKGGGYWGGKWQGVGCEGRRIVGMRLVKAKWAPMRQRDKKQSAVSSYQLDLENTLW